MGRNVLVVLQKEKTCSSAAAVMLPGTVTDHVKNKTSRAIKGFAKGSILYLLKLMVKTI